MTSGARGFASVACVALLILACRARDDPADPEAINPRIGVGSDTLAPETIDSALAARLGGTSRGGRVFCAYTPLGQEANRIAVWALCQEFVASGDSVETGTGSSAPALLVVDASGGGAAGARIAEVRVPRDGNFWSRDVESIFPNEVVRRIQVPTAAHNRRAQLLLTQNREAARAHYARTRSASTDTACVVVEPATTAGSRVVWVNFACVSPAAVPGQLYRAYRRVHASADPVEAALRELVRGPSQQEEAIGLSSFFSERTADALQRVTHSSRGDTVTIDFTADLAGRLPPSPEVKSFLPPGIMAELTGTVFAQFPKVQAIRFRFDGSERAFWQWLSGEPRAFTRRDWEQV
jgi:hypothetical protein